MNSFEESEVWKACTKFRMEVSNLVRTFPSDEKFRLVDQLLRSSHSSTANIAEGHGRYHYQENIQFCRQARGSLSESLDHLICAFAEGLLDNTQLEELRKIYSQYLKLSTSYVLCLKKKKADC